MKRHRLHFTSHLCLFLATAAICRAASAASTVEWKEGLLSVSAVGAPRAEVLREVARQSGIKLVGLENVTGTVSTQLTGADLRAGLKVLAGDSGYVLVRSPAKAGGRERIEIFFLGRGSATTPPSDITKRAPTAVAYVEDSHSGEMVPIVPPNEAASVSAGVTVRSGQTRVTVRVDGEMTDE